jgi:UPF0755 protein
LGLIKKIVVGICVGGLVAFGAGFGFFQHLEGWSQSPFSVSPPKTLTFKSGTSLGQLAAQLEETGIIDDQNKFHWYVRFFAEYRLFQAGLYQFSGPVTPVQVVETIQAGLVYRTITLQITIPEGFTLKNVTERLAANGVGHIVALQNLVKDPKFIAQLKINAPTLEGYLYPATYSFETLPSPQAALTKMVQTFFQNLPKDYEEKVKALGLTLHQAVTFASLIELETQLEEEKPVIAEVIWNRIKAKMPLGIDAALIYGIPDYKGDILWSHLADKSNPYNTRIHQGLPPTPIGAPGVNSLLAILSPTNLGYLYYVLMPGTVRHHFSKTLKEHNEQVKKLIEATKKPGSPTNPKKPAAPSPAPDSKPLSSPDEPEKAVHDTTLHPPSAPVASSLPLDKSDLTKTKPIANTPKKKAKSKSPKKQPVTKKTDTP